VSEQVLPALDSRVDVPDDLSALPGLSVTADIGPKECRLRLSGVLDADTVPLFTACISGWVDRGRSHLVIDLSAVNKIDAAGAAALSRAVHVLQRTGGSAHVISPNNASLDITERR
jgi:anti-anti-sigma factor